MRARRFPAAPTGQRGRWCGAVGMRRAAALVSAGVSGPAGSPRYTPAPSVTAARSAFAHLPSRWCTARIPPGV
ncbi:hypothetical protein MRX96_015127 [Rhipicephalus microplus]